MCNAEGNMQKAACMLLAAAGAGSYWLLTFFFPLRCFISVRSGGGISVCAFFFNRFEFCNRLPAFVFSDRRQ